MYQTGTWRSNKSAPAPGGVEIGPRRDAPEGIRAGDGKSIRSPTETVPDTRGDPDPGPASGDVENELDPARPGGDHRDPDPPGDAGNELPEDGTLGGYMAEHSRPPSFEGADGHPYTVSVEVEQIGDLRTPFAGYLVFPRWSHGGREIVGHVQTPILTRGRSHAKVVDSIGEIALIEIKKLLDEGIQRMQSGEVP